MKNKSHFALFAPPACYSDMVEAWDRLGEEWQEYVRLIKWEYMHLIKTE